METDIQLSPEEDEWHSITTQVNQMFECQRSMLDKTKKIKALLCSVRENIQRREFQDEIQSYVEDMETSLIFQDAQINCLLHDLEIEESKKVEAEQEKKKLQEQIEQLTEQQTKYQCDAMKKEEQLQQAETGHQLMVAQITDIANQQYQQIMTVLGTFAGEEQITDRAVVEKKQPIKRKATEETATLTTKKIKESDKTSTLNISSGEESSATSETDQDEEIEINNLKKSIISHMQDLSSQTLFHEVMVIADTNIYLVCLDLLKDIMAGNVPDFPDIALVLPWTVVRELDGLKKPMRHGKFQPKKTVHQARDAIKFIHSLLIQKHQRLLSQTEKEATVELMVVNNNDDRIVNCLLQYKIKFPNSIHILLSRDENLLNQALINDNLATDDKTLPAYLKQQVINRQQTSAPAVMPDTAGTMPPTDVHVDDDSKLTLHGLQHHYVKLENDEKNTKLFSILDFLDYVRAIIFVKNPENCMALAQLLEEKRFSAVAIHRAMTQEEIARRIRTLQELRNDILVATDLIRQGMDLKKVNIVINYDIPENSDAYFLKVGRAFRFGTKGLAITFVSDESDAKILHDVQERFEVNITELPDKIDISSYMDEASIKIGSFTFKS